MGQWAKRDFVMATDLSNEIHCCNMVWELKTKQMPNTVQKVQLVVEKRASGMDESFEMLKCNEDLPSSPGYASSDNRMEYDDLPELQAVQTDPTTPPVFQLTAGVSHQECLRSSWTMHTSNSPECAYPPDGGVNRLTELADIATSPQSPLMQCSFYDRSSPVHIIATSKSLHSYARPPPSSSVSKPCFSKKLWNEQATVEHQQKSSESESDIFCMSSLSDDDDLGWSHSWPSTVWHCFLKGTRLCFHKGHTREWQDVEKFANGETHYEGKRDINWNTYKGYGSDGLKLISHEETLSFGQSVLKLTFDPGSPEDGLITVECRLDHPFYVKSKGWSSFYPSLTVVQHGIPCCDIQVGDICLPPGHPDAINFDDSGVFDTFKSYDFTPLDSSAVYVLSSMARQRRASLSGGSSNSSDYEKLESSKDFVPSRSSHHPCNSFYGKSVKSHSSGTSSTVSATSNKCKRPMNAFMLFAKKYRVEYTQMYPGKDNRAISVILGDRWKKMKNEERRVYTMEAKALAEEQKRLNPDCWKRKRTNSGSQQS
uniref:HMG box-containing protein 1 n=3 Tax=Latimeria chalumnae TaxID=7897 RepID=H3AL32_LATCH|nr:PREDICTED: HMG box-containing protein 1 isoform X2 [Latimeria chalumnae]|eukprot:XP_006006054.2 PREDICTED: HMG box-containing protein 1 isoform X2 [Latimeria chalumnae]